jgi:hypothetical protein
MAVPICHSAPGGLSFSLNDPNRAERHANAQGGAPSREFRQELS